MPTALILRAAGTNCDREMVRAFELAGAEARLVHLDSLIAKPQRLDEADLLGFPGGFSYGDDIASGRIFAMKIRERLYPALRAAALRGCPMIGACNGFQVLVQAGLLPGAPAGDWPDSPPEPTLALTDNITARFRDDWIGMEVVPDSVCIWTKHLRERAGGGRGSAPPSTDTMLLPVAHGEGRLVARDEATLDALESGGQIALRYRDNSNGSARAIAGVCDPTGRIFGLMPHPERYLEWNRHPYWTRLPAELKRGPTPGLLVFQAAVEAVAGVRIA